MIKSDVPVLPALPGVYRFLDGNGRVLYVGKAKSLASRVSSYFSSPHSVSVAQMVVEAVDVSFTIVGSEREALLLEARLISELSPPYNVLVYDDTSYPWIALDSRSEFPRVFLAHHKTSRGVERFGPFASYSDAKHLLDVIGRVFGVRPCADKKFRDYSFRGVACMTGQMGLCAAPCLSGSENFDSGLYAESVAAVRSLLRGRVSSTRRLLSKQMTDASDSQFFELAATLRDRLVLLDSIRERQVVVGERGEFDVVGVAVDDVGAAVQILRVREGAVVSTPTKLFDSGLAQAPSVETILPLLSSFFVADVPPVVVVSKEVSGLSELFSSLDLDVSVKVPRSGRRADLLEMAQENAQAVLSTARRSRARDITTRRSELTELSEALFLPSAPLRLECYDVSHLGGTGVVCSMVVLLEGLPATSHYRAFSPVQQNDDVASLSETLARRLAYLCGKETSDVSLSSKPDLLVIDGGLPQLNAVVEVVDRLGLDIPVVSLAKRFEECLIPGRAPVLLPFGSAPLFLLQRARDEAHRFANVVSKKKRFSRQLMSPLDVPGVGPKRREELLEKFGSLSGVASATVEELSEVVPASVAVVLFEALRV